MPDASETKAWDVQAIRRHFPILERELAPDRPLIYLDNAATTQKPDRVIEATRRFYEEMNSNVHRGVHTLSQRATEAFEGARETMARFLGAASSREIVFVRGATEAVNLVANTFGLLRVGPGDEVCVSQMEHHSNIVPWQMLCDRVGATLRPWPIDERGQLRMELADEMLTEKTRLLAVNHISNALGTVNPVKELARLAHAVGARILVDGAQGTPHERVRVQEIDCDFYVVSGHKMYGPTGIGVLYGKRELLEEMPPWQGGGDMILEVSFEGSTYNEVPAKFEAGTPDVCGAIGLAEAARFLEETGLESIKAWEQELTRYGEEMLRDLGFVRRIGTAEERVSVLSFVVEGVHPHDIGTILDQKGVAIRAGHHCAQPVMQHFGVPATARASLAMYNTKEEVDALGRALVAIKEIFG